MRFSVFAIEKLALYGLYEMYTKRINGKITASSLDPCMKPILY